MPFCSIPKIDPVDLPPMAEASKDVEAPPVPVAFPQPQESSGLIVTAELDTALEECKQRVRRIAKDCRAKNRKFRDIEFDIVDDTQRCLHGLDAGEVKYQPSGTQRLAEIFEHPQFFVDGAGSEDLVQGAIGDCWFVAAVAMMATSKGLVERFCVARDEEVGVYGFIFFRDNRWVNVVIDDLLYTTMPKFEELSHVEQGLYHHDRDMYNKTARMGRKIIYFAHGSTEGETWVPLLEKAYAKLHGSYAALERGNTSEGVEDLTGGVSSEIMLMDILDKDKFWNEELMRAATDRLFGCSTSALNSVRSGDQDARVKGLVPGHSYSILRAVECNGKRFLVIRNPWGESEWTGRWSDGSKEWTPEWLAILPQLGHAFGNDGQFVMEYADFLDCWTEVDRTVLFDSSWAMSSHYLRVEALPLPCAYTYGDISFKFTISKVSPTRIVLTGLDNRYFAPISGRYRWEYDFILYRKGQEEPICESLSSKNKRSVNVEIDLEPGDYIVHVRMDRRKFREEGYFEKNAKEWNPRNLSRALTERSISQALASNFIPDANNIPIALSTLAGKDIGEHEAEIAARKQKELADAAAATGPVPNPYATPVFAPATVNYPEGPRTQVVTTTTNAGPHLTTTTSLSIYQEKAVVLTPAIDPENATTLGLRVYTDRGSPVTIEGKLRRPLNFP